MKAIIVTKVGLLTEHSDGRIDLFDWNFDCDCCLTPHVAAYRHHEELIKLAKETGTYRFKEEA